MKITYKTNVLDIIRLVENNTPALWEKEYNNFPNTWGGVNALTKQVDLFRVPWSAKIVVHF